MSKARNKGAKALASIIIWGVALLLTTISLRYHLLQDIESKTWDWRIRLVAKQTRPDPRIKIIMVDQDSIDRFAQEEKIYWPWPRSVYAPVLSFLKVAGAKGIAFDMLFTEQQTQVADDEVFASALGSTVPVVSSLALNSRAMAQPEVGPWQELVSLQAKQVPFREEYLSSPFIKNFEGATVPIQEIIRNSAALGTVNEDFDPDRIFRRVSPGGKFKDIPILTLPFAFYHLMEPKGAPRKYLESIQDPNGKYLVKFRGPARTYPWYTIDSIISSALAIESGAKPLVDPTEFKDSFVFLGPSASALLDLRPCPFPGLFPGVEVHATTFDNLLNRDFMREATFYESVGAAAIALLLVIVTSMFFVRFQIIVLSVLYVLWVLVCFEVGLQGVWLPMVIPLVSMVIVTIASVAFQYQLEGKQYKFIRGAFQYYVTPEVIDQIVDNPSSLSLGGERRTLTILFSDIQGFTSISESMEPAKLVQFLNKFLSEMTDIILSHGGTIDKYEGDAIIAFWNAPLSVQDHETRAIEASLRCQRRLVELKEHFREVFGVEVRMRIGINTGGVTVGNFGSTTRFNYTIIGDAANLASRLEGANKVFGTEIMAAVTTKRASEKTAVWRRLGELQVVGRSNTVEVWEPMDPKSPKLSTTELQSFDKGLDLFYQGEIHKAREHFKALASKDPVSAAYLRRTEEASGEVFNPVWVLSAK
jgi:adenylate cyclase